MNPFDWKTAPSALAKDLRLSESAHARGIAAKQANCWALADGAVNAKTKPVEMRSANGDVRRFASARTASMDLGLNQSMIADACRAQKSYAGCSWRYVPNVRGVQS